MSEQEKKVSTETDPFSRKKTLTKNLNSLRERINLLELELSQLTNSHFRVCIFGSARIKPHDAIYQDTEKLALLLGQESVDVLTGGGPGLMEAANKGCLAGKKKAGTKSKSFGITIQLNQFEEKPSEHLDIKHHHRKFSSRLDDFMRLSHAIIVVPGGIGTVLELYYSWQLLQVGHISERPIILLGKDFWNGLFKWTEDVQLVKGLLCREDFRWIHVVDTPEEVLEIVLKEKKSFLESKQESNQS